MSRPERTSNQGSAPLGAVLRGFNGQWRCRIARFSINKPDALPGKNHGREGGGRGLVDARNARLGGCDRNRRKHGRATARKENGVIRDGRFLDLNRVEDKVGGQNELRRGKM